MTTTHANGVTDVTTFPGPSAVVDIRTRGVVAPALEPLPPVAEVLAELLAEFERAHELLDPTSEWAGAIDRSIAALRRHLG